MTESADCKENIYANVIYNHGAIDYIQLFGIGGVLELKHVVI